MSGTNTPQQPSINLDQRTPQGFLGTDGAGGFTAVVVDGVVNPPALAGPNIIQFTFSEPRPSNNYTVVAQRTDLPGFATSAVKTNLGFQLLITDVAGAPIDPAAVAVTVEFFVGKAID